MFTYLKWYVVNDRQDSEHEGKLDLFSHMLGLHDQYTSIPQCEQMSHYFPLRVVQHVIYITLKL